MVQAVQLPRSVDDGNLYCVRMKHMHNIAQLCIFHRYCRTVACGQPQFPETKSGQAENDIVSLASSFLMVQVFRFGFTGGSRSVGGTDGTSENS